MPQRNKIGFQHWNTPPEVCNAIAGFLPITLDPCSNPTSVVPAAVKIELPQDGLTIPWHRYGHTFINPPYAVQRAWLAKAVAEYAAGPAYTVTALVPAATETENFRAYVFGGAAAIAFWSPRIAFLRAGGAGRGNSLPSVLAYWGPEIERFAQYFQNYATVVTEWIGKNGIYLKSNAG